MPKDRHVKLPIYAAAGIQEYWIVDLQQQVLHVFRSPRGDVYMSETQLAAGELISPLACPDLVVQVSEIFA
jgi:Uma2 family endonuclease